MIEVATGRVLLRMAHSLAALVDDPEIKGVLGYIEGIRDGDAFIAALAHAATVGKPLAFLKVGRMPFDPMNTTGIQMPPKGGNPLLSDQDLLDAIALLRTFAPLKM